MKNYVQKGDILEYTNAGSAISAGDVVVIGALIGIALTDIAASTGVGSVSICGCYTVAKTTSLSISQGDKLYWSTGTSKVTKTATDKFMGHAAAAAASDATTCVVKLADDGSQITQAAVVAALTGTLTGTANGSLADVADIATAGGSTPTAAQVDTAVNGAIAEVNTQLKELQTTLNAALAALKAAGLMASA